jgi:hypothetical protein
VTGHSGFFAVGQETFIKACGLGINPACAFLVMASGTGADNTVTRWSAEAVGQRVAMRWTTAKEAIGALCRAGIAKKSGPVSKPSYRLEKKGELIWLPSSLVEGFTGRIAPIVQLRQTQDAMLLRLLCELYLSQNLREDGGISTKVVYQTFASKMLFKQGKHTVWDFLDTDSSFVCWTGVTLPHKREVLTPEEEKAGKNVAVDFFRRFHLLLSLGLVKWVPHLYDGPNGEPMHPLKHLGVDIESTLYHAASEAARRMADKLGTIKIPEHGMAVPVPSHIAEATVIGVARLEYRPATSLTGVWWAEHQARCIAFTEQYKALAAPVSAPVARGGGHRSEDKFWSNF